MIFLKKHRGPILIVVLALGAWFALRTTPTALASIDELDARIARGEPVVLEFFANT